MSNELPVEISHMPALKTAPWTLVKTGWRTHKANMCLGCIPYYVPKEDLVVLPLNMNEEDIKKTGFQLKSY